MILKISLAFLLSLSSFAYAGGDCEFSSINTKITFVNNDALQIDRFYCGDDYVDDGRWYDPSLFFENVVVEKSNGKKIQLSNQDWTKIKVLKNPVDFPYVAIYRLRTSASSLAGEVLLFDKDWRQVASLGRAINQYQANNRKGSEHDLVGFFKLKDDFYIESLTQKEWRQYVVDTYKLVNDSLVKVDRREYNMEHYQQYQGG